MLRPDTQIDEYFEVEDPEGGPPRLNRSKEKIRRQFISEEYAVKMQYIDNILWEFELVWS